MHPNLLDLWLPPLCTHQTVFRLQVAVQMDNDQNKNLIIATALSFVVILVWFVLFPPPEPDTPIDGTKAELTAPLEGSLATPSADAPTTAPAATSTADTPPSALETAPVLQSKLHG